MSFPPSVRRGVLPEARLATSTWGPSTQRCTHTRLCIRAAARCLIFSFPPRASSVCVPYLANQTHVKQILYDCCFCQFSEIVERVFTRYLAGDTSLDREVRTTLGVAARGKRVGRSPNWMRTLTLPATSKVRSAGTAAIAITCKKSAARPRARAPP